MRKIGMIAGMIGLTALSAPALEVGDAAPPFTAPASDGTPVSLTDYQGQWVVLYFYPKADTPGCTKQACSLRDGYSGLEEAGAVVLGVSLDDASEQAAFKSKYNLPFTLLSDRRREVAEAYGVLPPGGMFAQRKTFIIDSQQKIAHIFERVNVREHDTEVLNVLHDLKTTAE